MNLEHHLNSVLCSGPQWLSAIFLSIFREYSWVSISHWSLKEKNQKLPLMFQRYSSLCGFPLLCLFAFSGMCVHASGVFSVQCTLYTYWSSTIFNWTLNKLAYKLKSNTLVPLTYSSHSFTRKTSIWKILDYFSQVDVFLEFQSARKYKFNNIRLCHLMTMNTNFPFISWKSTL